MSANSKNELLAKTAFSTLFSIAANAAHTLAFEQVMMSRKYLQEKHPFEPLVHHATNYAVHLMPKSGQIEHIQKQQHDFLKMLHVSHEDTIKVAAKKIKKNQTVFMHAPNKHLLNIAAHTHHPFTVHVLQHHPDLLGKEAKLYLKEHNIKVRIFKDIELHDAIKDVDMCVIRGLVINKNKVGTASGGLPAALVARELGIPVYVCAPSLHYHPSIEHPGEHVQDDNLTGIITDLGIHTPKQLHYELRSHYPWMFKF